MDIQILPKLSSHKIWGAKNVTIPHFKLLYINSYLVIFTILIWLFTHVFDENGSFYEGYTQPGIGTGSSDTFYSLQSKVEPTIFFGSLLKMWKNTYCNGFKWVPIGFKWVFDFKRVQCSNEFKFSWNWGQFVLLRK